MPFCRCRDSTNEISVYFQNRTFQQKQLFLRLRTPSKMPNSDDINKMLNLPLTLSFELWQQMFRWQCKCTAKLDLEFVYAFVFRWVNINLKCTQRMIANQFTRRTILNSNHEYGDGKRLCYHYKEKVWSFPVTKGRRWKEPGTKRDWLILTACIFIWPIHWTL